MKRFVITLASLSAIMLLVVVGMHVVAILNLQDDVDAAYTIPKGTEILAIGSSQLGCSLDDDSKYKMYKLWVSDTMCLLVGRVRGKCGCGAC